MAEYTGEVLPLNTNINPATGKPVGAVADALFKEAKDTAKKKMEEETSPESLLSSPPAMVTYGAMAAEAARRAAPYIKDFFTQPQVPERIEPTFTPPSIPETPVDVAMSAAGEQTKTDLLQQKLAEAKAAIGNKAPAEFVGPRQPVPPTNANPFIGPQQPMTPPELAGPPEHPGVVYPEVKSRAPRRTAEQIVADKAAQTAAGPEKWLTSQFGNNPEAYQEFIKTYNQGKPYTSMPEAYASIEQNLGGPKKSEFLKSKKGIPVPREMEVGPVKQSGMATPGMLANVAGNVLGALGLMQGYKQGKASGDWSDFGLGLINQIAANVTPKLATPLALMTPTTMAAGTLNSPEAKELFERSKKKAVKPY